MLRNKVSYKIVHIEKAYCYKNTVYVNKKSLKAYKPKRIQPLHVHGDVVNVFYFVLHFELFDSDYFLYRNLCVCAYTYIGEYIYRETETKRQRIFYVEKQKTTWEKQDISESEATVYTIVQLRRKLTQISRVSNAGQEAFRALR